MSRLRVLSIFGTRPEAVKMGPVVHALAARADEIESVVCVTAQHRELLDQVLRLFDIKPDHDLNLMKQGQSITGVASLILAQLEDILSTVRPDWVLVQGDTTTVMAAAIAAFYSRCRVGHVEAGLRSFDKWQPFPEEINRKIAGATADLHFAPTERSRQNLLREGVDADSIVVTGNTVIDALHWAAKRPETDVVRDIVQSCELDSGRRLIYMTVHRRENFGESFEAICEAVRALALHYGSTVHFVYPVHPNPNIATPARRLLGNLENVTLLEPLDYLPNIQLMRRATIVLTDSGGVQEEAPGFGKPVLVLRETTERPEAVDAGTVRLVGANRDRVFEETRKLLDDAQHYSTMAHAVNPYGDGLSAPRIVDSLLRYK
jgi:UDP-N-acetylglucosamine 2-epimerase (non-hydrolysing)